VRMLMVVPNLRRARGHALLNDAQSWSGKEMPAIACAAPGIVFGGPGIRDRTGCGGAHMTRAYEMRRRLGRRRLARTDQVVVMGRLTLAFSGE
jgi:hypothetical protein